MKTLCTILTYRRVGALQETLRGMRQHCAHYDTAVFEDCGNRDSTSHYLSQGEKTHRPHLLADEYAHPDGFRAFLGRINLGVAGNSNRAIKVFMDGDWDHLCLMNDDIHVLGDFPAFYGKAHRDLGVGLWLMNDFMAESPTHQWIIARSRGYRVKIFTRATGIMMSMTRQLVEKIGYFDSRFEKFGEEHVDFTHRARFAGELKLDGQDQACLDVEPSLPNGKAGLPLLKHQNVETSVVGTARKTADAEAAICMREAVARYQYEHFYRPFRLMQPKTVGGLNDTGMIFAQMSGYALLNATAP